MAVGRVLELTDEGGLHLFIMNIANGTATIAGKRQIYREIITYGKYFRKTAHKRNKNQYVYE